MDMYRILENFDAVNSKKTLVEGQMKRQLEARAEQMSKAAFVADAGEYGMSPEEAAEFWIAVNGGDEEVDEAYDKLPADQLGLDKFSQAALAGGQRKRDALANPNHTRMLAKKSAQQQPVREAGEAFAKGDRVMYLNGFATVIGQDGDSYIVKVDGQPNTMKVPATAIKKPSYDESKKFKPEIGRAHV
jgi:preprotein translocase subunit YajC